MRRLLIGVTLFGLIILALWTRYQFVEMYGGRAPSYLAWANDHYFGGLSSFYVTTARSWNEGRPYTDLVYPPGYVIFLATGSKLVGSDLNRLRILQGAIDSATLAAVYVLAGTLGLTMPWALAAATTYAVLPLWAAGSTFLLAESLTVPLLVWEMVFLAWASRARTLWVSAAAGTWLGLSALVRPDLMLFVLPAAALVLTNRRRSPWLPLLALVLAFAAVVGTWGLHNRRVHRAWVIGSTNRGASLWEGLGEVKNNYGYVLDDSAANHFMAAHGYVWGSIPGNEYMTREYLKAWRDHTAFVARVIAQRARLILFWSDRLQPLFFGRVRGVLDAMGLIALLVAMWIRRREPSHLLMLAILPLYALGSIGLVHYEARYVRYVPVAYVLAALIVASAAAAIVNRRWPRAAVVLSVCFLLGAASYTVRELAAIRAAATMPERLNP